jgi:acyl-CoA synthetase (AMP-forming)/AMP-acid ligase II
MPNFAFQFVSRRTPASRRSDYDLSSARALINCSEPVRASSLREFEEAFSGIGLHPDVLRSSYAMAENVFAVTQSELSPICIWADKRSFRTDHVVRLVGKSDAEAISFVSSGTLLPNVEARIIDDYGAELPQGNAGEILIKTDTLFTGYYNRPDLTESAIQDGWYHTGDLGFVLNKDLFVVGRKKDLLIVGGENLYPQDIEEIVATHAAIHDGRAIAMGLYNPDLGTEDVVVVAEVEREEMLAESERIEQEVRNLIVAGTGVAARKIFVKPPKWIVKSTAGKPARAATREKLILEHPELNGEGQS